MRVGVIPENLLERIGLLTNLAPVPLAENLFAFLLARTVMVATRLGVFEALGAGALRPEEVAARCGTDPAATAHLLHALTGCRYLAVDGERYELTRMSRKWLLADQPGSCRDRLLFQFLEWQWSEHTEEYVRTGRPIAAFAAMSEQDWGLYQRGMRAGIDPLAKELARRVALPRGPARMLDLGGGHGHYSVAFCRRHPSLSATVFERPEAIAHAAEILARDRAGARVVHVSGDVLSSELGEDTFDLVFMSALIHHFDDETNRGLMKRVARALRPGGVVCVSEALRRDPAVAPGQVSALMDLFLATISPAGTRFPAVIAGWQREAGLVPRKPLWLRLAPDLGAQCAVKPRGASSG